MNIKFRIILLAMIPMGMMLVLTGMSLFTAIQTSRSMDASINDRIFPVVIEKAELLDSERSEIQTLL